MALKQVFTDSVTVKWMWLKQQLICKEQFKKKEYIEKQKQKQQ